MILNGVLTVNSGNESVKYVHASKRSTECVVK